MGVRIPIKLFTLNPKKGFRVSGLGSKGVMILEILLHSTQVFFISIYTYIYIYISVGLCISLTCTRTGLVCTTSGACQLGWLWHSSMDP